MENNYNVLGLIYTYKCSSACDICAFSCSPEREEKMDLEDGKKLISQAKECKIRMLGIAGGEPLVYADEVIELIRYGKSFGIPSTITTNCFWGKTYEEAHKMISRLVDAGLHHIKISADDYHNKFVPYENVINVIRAVNQFSPLKIVISCTSTKNSGRLKGLLEHIQDETIGKILLEQFCYPVGRAKDTVSKKDFMYSMDNGTACRDKGMLLVTPDGGVYPCGSMCSIVESRKIGSIHTESLQDIINKAYKEKHNILISQHGIKPYYEYIKKNNLPVELTEEIVDTCHGCYELFKKQENLLYLDEIADFIAR